MAESSGLKNLRGMYAFAIYDKKKITILSRDILELNLFILSIGR